LAIGPFARIITKLKGFCAQSNNAAPNKGSQFSIERMGNEALISVAKLISKSKFPPQLYNEFEVMFQRIPLISQVI